MCGILLNVIQEWTKYDNRPNWTLVRCDNIGLNKTSLLDAQLVLTIIVLYFSVSLEIEERWVTENKHTNYFLKKKCKDRSNMVVVEVGTDLKLNMSRFHVMYHYWQYLEDRMLIGFRQLLHAIIL